MTKRKTRKHTQQLFDNLSQLVNHAEADGDEEVHSSATETCPITALSQASIFRATLEEAQESGEIPRMKKFRFQLLHLWLTQNYPPCKVADIGGGKGFLAYLLQCSGWDATVIDPAYQSLPEKYKDLTLNQRVKIPSTARVPRRFP